MIPPKQVGVYGLGGMGDMYKWYCRQGKTTGWAYLQSLKERYPTTKTMALICSTNPHAVDLFTHNPYIDIIKYYAWPLNNKGNLLEPGQLKLAQILKKNGYPLINIKTMQGLGLEPKECIIYLNDIDKDELKKQTKGIESYIVVHPFASVPERQIIPLEQYSQLIDRLVEKLDHNIIILGKSYQRSFSSKGKTTSYNKEETIQITNPRVLNLVNKTNPRVAIKIVQNADKFIGVHSCFSCIAASEQIKTAILSNNKNYNIVQQTIRKSWTKKNNFSIINIDKQTWSDTINQIMRYLTC